MKNNTLILIMIGIISVNLQIGYAAETNINVLINGEKVTFTENTGYPFTDENNRTQVPFRVVLEKFNAKVAWKNNMVVAVKDDIQVEVPIGEYLIIKNGEKIYNDAAAVLKDERTYLPIRVVMEAFGCEVGLVKDKKTVTITEMEENKNEEIMRYMIPEKLGVPKLSKEEIDHIVGSEPSVIKDTISTVHDLLQYMISADYKVDSGDTQITVGDYRWHYNRGGESTIKVNKGNCGATASLVNYILQDDYDEVGFIVYSADSGQGGHVFNYIKQDDKYYIIDFLQYVMGNYGAYYYKIQELDTLEDYPYYCQRTYGNGSNKRQMKIIVAYTAENNLPIANKKTGHEYVMRYLPKGEDIQVLLETPEEGKVVEYIDRPTEDPKFSDNYT